MSSSPVLVQIGKAPTPPRAVRLSLTDRCDLACVYCRPHRQDGYLDERLDLDGWTTMVRGLVDGGVRRVRITGGEPLLSPHVVEVVRRVAALGVDDLALTTNATRLARLAAPLREAGLRRLNISLDTLDPERFRRMTRGGDLATVLEGIEAACAAGFDELKLNVVVLRGDNDDELPSLVRFAWEREMVPRLLELMAIGEGAHIAERFVSYAEMRGRLAALLEDDEPVRDPDRGPARYVYARGARAATDELAGASGTAHGAGYSRRVAVEREAGSPRGRLAAQRAGFVRRVGFITGTSDTYCGGCDRLRVASDGVLRPCLATNDGVAAATAVSRGDVASVTRLLGDAWRLKPDGETFKGCTEDSARSVSIRAIGG